jgi:hypothetical protein
MTIELFVGLTGAVFIGTLAAGFAGKVLVDWHGRRAWQRMEARLFAQAKRMKGEIDAEFAKPRNRTIYPKPRAN